MSGSISILCDEVEYNFNIDDVDPEFLQEACDLDEKPKILYESKNNSVIPSKKWQARLMDGHSYYIKKKGNKTTKQDDKTDEMMGELVLNSLIVSTAVYHLHYKVSTWGCLYEQFHWLIARFQLSTQGLIVLPPVTLFL